LETPIYYEGVDGIYNLTGTSSNCTDPEACNYNQNLNPELDDPSTCNYTTCLRCTDENACDYSPFASIDDGSCNTTCEGCTDSAYTNYDPNADIDDGSCANIGCDYPLASNYNPEVTIVDDSCIILGCTDPSICNYNWFLNGESIFTYNEPCLHIVESGNYSLSINSENGCSDSSDEIFVQFVGVDEQSLAFKAYPNPCDEQLELHLNETGTWNLRVMDTLGRIIDANTIQGNTYVLNTKALSNGTYTLMLHGNQEVKHLKFIVQH